MRKILDALSEYSNAVYNDSFSLRNTMGVSDGGGGGGGGGGGDSDGDDSASFFDHTAHLHELGMRLLPLRHIEQLLIAKLVPPDEEEATHFGTGASPGGFVSSPGEASGSGSGGVGVGGSNVGYGIAGPSRARERSGRNQEIFVRPGTGWKGFVARGPGKSRPSDRSPSPSQRSSISQSQAYPKNNGHHGRAHSHSRPYELSQSVDLQDEPTAVLHACRHDIMALWKDPSVKEVLRKKKVRLEEQPGLCVFFFYVSE